MNRNAYNILFHMENEEITILEIKINAIESNDKSKIYHWLLFNKTDNKLTTLIFERMEKIEEKESRYFKKYYLEFDNQDATLKSENKTYNLLVISPLNTLNLPIKEAIDTYVQNLIENLTK